MQQIGRELAGPAGSILGAGIAGAGDSASEKAQRADRDEYVVLVASGVTLLATTARISKLRSRLGYAST